MIWGPVEAFLEHATLGINDDRPAVAARSQAVDADEIDLVGDGVGLAEHLFRGAGRKWWS